MQYILDEAEMAAIRAERDALRKIPCGGHDLIEAMTNVCKMVANTMIPTGHSAFNSPRSMPVDEPRGCVHNETGPNPRYCDRCPMQGICPLPKSYSK